MKEYNRFDLTNYNGYRLKSICNMAYFPEDVKDLEIIFKDKKSRKIILGSGYNTILTKAFYNESFIIFKNCFNRIYVNKNYIFAEAGVTSEELSIVALENCLSGVEIFYDIPGSLGGLICMNAGSNNEQISDLIESVEYFDIENMCIKTINNEDMKFSYRDSIFQKNDNMIILNVCLKLSIANYEDIFQKMLSNKKIRFSKQPRDYPNCGSVYKRPQGHFVGPLIDQVGLRGYSVGGAKISEKHCGFIINYNNAIGNDILKIIEETRKRVSSKYNINLQLEQKVI